MASRLKGRSFAETRSAILDLIRSSEQISRNELARRSGLTEATISKAVRALLDDGFVAESGFATSTGGKRPTLLRLNTESLFSVGIALDGERILYALCDLSGHATRTLATPGFGTTSPGEVMERVARELGEFLDGCGVGREEIIGIGVAAGGRLDNEGGVLRTAPEASEWERFPIEVELQRASGLPVVLENDANCAALGQFWSGRVPATRDFVTVYLATGIGCGIVINGDIYRGTSSNVGEIGHMVVQLGGEECWCGSRGCLETIASPPAIFRRALGDPELCRAIGLDPTIDSRVAFGMLAHAAVAGQPQAEALIRAAADELASAVLGLVNLLDINMLFLAGPGFGVAGDIYLETVREALRQRAFMRSVHSIDVELGTIGPEAAALGAASVVLHGRLTPHHSARRRDVPRGPGSGSGLS